MKIIVVGGGPAGMMAAYHAASLGHEVTLLEQNEKLGKKLYITGKGRCNVTNASDMDVVFKNVNCNPKFLYSAFYSFDNSMLMDFIKENGCELKVERGNRVFPVSDHSSDIIKACETALRQAHVSIRLHTKVSSLLVENNCVVGVSTAKERLYSDKVILATGGLSYPSTGSTGDGFSFAKEVGHQIMPTSGSLVPLECKETWVKDLQGLSLKNVTFTIAAGKKELFSELGEMLFTHFGISGPLVLSASSAYDFAVKKGQNIEAFIDLKPGLSMDELDHRILRDFESESNKQFKNVLEGLLPRRMMDTLVELSQIPLTKRVNEITREERLKLVSLLKHLPLTITKPRPIEEAIITRGGICTKEVNPSTMESKIVKNLYFAGEMLDVDAMTGGYNLQIAWSTGYLAGFAE